MINTDKPINQISEDKLGRSAFAKQLANAIVNFQTKDNYAVSLQGKWGCGKTSVLNMAIEEITHLSTNMDEKDKIIIIQFNPWNFTDTNQLINQFFLTLTNSLKIDSKDKKVKDVGAAIEKYSSALEYSEYIPIVGKYLKLIPKLSSVFGKSVKDNAELKLNDVSYRKREVEKALVELDSRILVVIDDIDRLSNEQIRLIFQLVNAVAGFSNITYLLSFDKDIVSRALGDVQGCKGQEYLEKIIQVPFDVPPLNISKLHNILFDKLNVLIELPNGVEFDRKRWSTVFSSCISPFINTLRDVNRYCNTLSFTYAAVKAEVDFIDMAGINALHIFAAPIFEWIRENKFSLIGGYSGGGVVLNELKKHKEETLQSFKELYPENSNVMLNAIASLFPLFSNSVLYPSDLASNNELHQAMRIAAKDKFDLYFSLSLDNIKISKKEVDNSLLNMEDLELRAYIRSLNERELFSDYLEEIKHNLSRIPEDRIELILSVLVFQSGRIKVEDTKLIGFGTAVISVYTISDLLFRIGNENIRYDIVASMLSHSDFESFQFLLHLLHIIELTHGRVAETSYIREEKLITLEHLYELEGIFLERTNSFLTETNLLDWKESRRASFLWEFIQKESYIDYMSETLADAFSLPKYISIKANEWSGSDGSCGYTFDDKSYTNFIDDATIIDTINKVRFSDSFWALDKRAIETSAAFILKSTNTMGNHEGTILLINEIIDRWKKEFTDQAPQ
ncbi:KAP family P-loop NTPase fold protein [[Clostridium] fimetarium]|uniref:KAP family P-loop domain-containing protein n=1 Tax=[Clostridium] fimetarium TaxID=99656 RepID=A0A1I0RYF8_9FIRM|nr:P-loop NTPase fold protein [[Clostridium] fimetarium]SEW46564.1 KAP family P-loop domain-containing protein [[Clostridium] fimetarium]